MSEGIEGVTPHEHIVLTPEIVKPPQTTERGAQENNGEKYLRWVNPREDELFSRDILEVSVLGGGCNEVYIAKLKDDGSGIFKPKKGENPGCGKYGIEVGSLYKRERAAYLVDHYLDLDLVPPTVIREINDDEGSFQDFIFDASTPLEVNPWKPKPDELEIEKQLYKLWVFDYIIWNSDRREDNVLIKNDKVYAIDHGLSFGAKYFGPYEQYFDKSAPTDLIEKLDNFNRDSVRESALSESLNKLLSGKEVQDCMSRIENITGVLKEEGKINNKDVLSYPSG
jgi:Phosphatidylinositol 3- and 4-kinase